MGSAAPPSPRRTKKPPVTQLQLDQVLALAKPMLLVEHGLDLDATSGWIYEIKQDGFRIMALVHDGKVLLKTKSGADASRWFPEITDALATIPGGPHLLDGEAVVLDDIGRSDFDRLLARAARRGWYAGADPVVYAAFDLLVQDGVDLTALPLLERKARLAQLLTPAPPSTLLVGHFTEGARQLFEQAVLPLKLEGIVGKRIDSIYRPGVRSPDWVKHKRPGAVPAGRFSRK